MVLQEYKVRNGLMKLKLGGTPTTGISPMLELLCRDVLGADATLFLHVFGEATFAMAQFKFTSIDTIVRILQYTIDAFSGLES